MSRRDQAPRNRRGAVIVLMVIMLPVVLLLAAFAINLAYMELNRTELVAAADAAARAGGREFASSRSQASARSKAKAIARLNSVAGKPLRLDDNDLTFGTSTRASSTDRYAFTAGGSNPNALEVTARRTASSLDGPIPLLMPQIMGIGTFESEQAAISTQVEVDVALVIDRSGSMAYAAHEPAAYPQIPSSAPAGWQFCDPAPPDCRWRNVVTAVGVFLSEVNQSPPSEFVSLSTYSGSAITNQDLTGDYPRILSALEPITNSLCSGGTNIGSGISEGLGAVHHSPAARPGAAKVIIVLTDGIHNTGTSPSTVASAAADVGTMIFTVTFSSEADQPAMSNVASLGGGKHFHANSPSDLVVVFQEIVKQLPTLLTH